MSGDGSNPGSNSSGEGVRTLTAADIAAAAGGELRGDPAARVASIAPLHRAGPSDLTFLAAARYAPLLADRLGLNPAADYEAFGQIRAAKDAFRG